MPITFRPTRSQSGVSLIEILVALFTLSIGLLGLAAMQTKSLQFNQSAYMRTQATIFANDLIDRMRTNEDSAANYVLSLSATPAASSTDCQVASCAPAQLATFDLHQWVSNIAGQLPNGDGAVIDLGGGYYRISVSWMDRDDETRTFSVEARI